jgi:hypothetical protein
MAISPFPNCQLLVDRLSAIGRALMARPATKHSGDAVFQDAPVARWYTVMVAGLLVQRPQRFHHVLEAHRVLGPGCLAQCRRRLDRAGIRGPRCEDGALLVERQVGIPMIATMARLFLTRCAYSPSSFGIGADPGHHEQRKPSTRVSTEASG